MSDKINQHDKSGVTTASTSEACFPTSAIRVLALVEAETVTGPAKNIFEFERVCRANRIAPSVELSVAIFQRPQKGLPGFPKASQFMERASELGVPVYRIGEGFRFDPRIVGHFRRLVERLDPDLIQTHHAKSHFVMWMSGLWKERPWIAFHHGHSVPRFRSRIYNNIGVRSLRNAGRIVSVSRAFEEYLVRRGLPKSRIVVIHNAVSLSPRNHELNGAARLAKRKALLDISPTDRVVLSIGRFSREKAQGDLVAAIHRLTRQHPEIPVQLVLVGEGPELENIKQAVRSAGLQGRVKMPGQVRDVQPYYETADIVAIPSLSEGSPNVLLEAMAAGVPVAATAVGGIPEIVSNRESALLVPPCAPLEMAGAIREILTTPVLAATLVGNARELIRSRYSPDIRARALVRLYSSVCPAHRDFDGPSGSAIQRGL